MEELRAAAAELSALAACKAALREVLVPADNLREAQSLPADAYAVVKLRPVRVLAKC